MSRTEDIVKCIEDNKDLLEKVQKLWEENASAEEYSQVMVDYGIEADSASIEEAFAEIQANSAKIISMRDLNQDELEKVSGGGYTGLCDGTDDCDDLFQKAPNTPKRCKFWLNCDDWFVGY